MTLTWPLLLPTMLTISLAAPAHLGDGDAHNRTSRDQECYEDEYWHMGKCCRSCPAGTSVSVHCTVNHARSICQSCAPDYFTAAPNGLESCLPCRICKDEKVFVQECTPTSNAICECKPGYYCTPDGPCEMCNRCSRCREGQRIKKPCTSTTDTVCEDYPPEPTSTKTNVPSVQTVPMQTSPFNETTGHRTISPDPPDDPSGYKSVVFISVAATILTIIIILIILIVRNKRKGEGTSKDNIENSLISGTLNNSTNTSLDSIRAEDPACSQEELPPECQSLMTAEHRKVETVTNVMAVPYVHGAGTEPGESSVAESLGGDVECEGSLRLGAECQECKKQQPCDLQWSHFNYAIINNVQPQYIVQLARRLCHHKAAIDQIIKNNPNDCSEQNYQLLSHWRDEKGEQASMRAVLNELTEMGLGGRCQNIENDLISRKIPIN